MAYQDGRVPPAAKTPSGKGKAIVPRPRPARQGGPVYFSQYRSSSQPKPTTANPQRPVSQIAAGGQDQAEQQVAEATTISRWPGRRPAEPRDVIPLVDIVSLLRLAWSYRIMVLGIVLACMVLGAAASTLVPRKFSSVATLYFDPAQIRTTQDDNGDRTVPSDVITTTIDSQTRIISSVSVMQKVAEKLKLASDPEFAGKAIGNPMLGIVERLQKATKIEREENTYVATVKVTTSNGQKSAEIANAVVDTFLNAEQTDKLDKYSTVNATFSKRLDELRKLVETSENDVETYRAENDLIAASGDLIADKRLAALNELLVTTQQATIAAKSKYDAASGLDVNNVITGTVGEEVASSTLADLRGQYATLAANVGSLESKMGSRHPSLIAAKASMAELRSEISNELSRTIAGARQDYEQALKNQKDLEKELATQKALQSTSSPEMVQLKELERKAAAASAIYEAALKRAKETNEEQNLLQNNIRVISMAMPPLKADGAGGTILMAAGMFGGLMLGLGLGILVAIVRNLLAGRGLRPAAA